MDGKEIQPSSQKTYLGVILDSQLSWGQHITNKVLVRLHRPCSQWESVMRNLTGSIFEYAQIFYLHYTDTKKAIFMFVLSSSPDIAFYGCFIYL